MTTPYRLLPTEALAYFTETTAIQVPVVAQGEAAATPMA